MRNDLTLSPDLSLIVLTGPEHVGEEHLFETNCAHKHHGADRFIRPGAAGKLAYLRADLHSYWS